MIESFVQIDPQFQNLIVLAVTALVGFLLLQLSATVPKLGEYLGQYKAGIVTWLSGLALNLFQNILNDVPANWEGVASLLMRLIVEVAVVLGVFAYLQKRGVKALQ